MFCVDYTPFFLQRVRYILDKDKREEIVQVWLIDIHVAAWVLTGPLFMTNKWVERDHKQGQADCK